MNNIYLILDNIRSILNVGAIFRTADAVGVRKIYLCGITAYPTNKEIRLYDKINVEEPISIKGEQELPEIMYIPTHDCIKNSLENKMKKTALMALGNVEWVYKPTAASAIKELKTGDVPIVVLEQDEKSVDYLSVQYKKPIALIVGHERLGVSQEAIQLCDRVVHIPMHGKGKSLNVATATGIALYKMIETK